MSPPSLWQHLRQIIGRAWRETGQALDRTAMRWASVAQTQYHFGDEVLRYQDFLSRHRQQFPLLHAGKPVIHPNVAYVAPCATLIGSVRVDAGASIWYGAILRADACANAESFRQSDEEILSNIKSDFELLDKDQYPLYPGGGIFVGQDTNIQDGCILTARTGHCRLGQGVTVGHLAQIHSSTVGDFSLIGMGSILQEGSRVEAEAFVAAGTVVVPGQVIPTGELWVGNPARKLRALSPAEREKLHYQSSEYVQVAATQHDVMELGGNLSEEMIENAVLKLEASTSPNIVDEEQDEDEDKQTQDTLTATETKATGT